jgi:tetratricopeptide (TPR) repeat protein
MDKVRVLFLAANPAGTPPLKLDEGIRQITAKVRAAEYRDSLELVSRWAVRPDDLLQALLEVKPHVVHFRGHGSSASELVLLDDQDNPKPVSQAALVHLFRTLKDNLRVVVLDACYSRPQAEALAQTVDCTVGMSRAIGDEAAIIFAASFYRAVGFGRSVKEAFELGRAALLLEGIPEDKTPELLTRKGVDAVGLVLISPPVAATPGAEQSGSKGPGERPGVPARLALVQNLSRLTPADWAILVALIPGAAAHISRHGTTPEQVAELLRWAESPTGLGLGTIERAFEGLLPHPLAGPLPPRGTPAAGRLFWNVPYPRNPFFTGRKDVLSELRKRLTKRGRTALAQVISGLGGIGKTQTAVEYAYRFRKEYEAVLWLNAESPLALKAGCGELARMMQLRHTEGDLDQVVLALKHWLETHSGWLLILDDADDPANLEPFLPAADHGHLLITSRAQDFQDLGVLEPMELPKLPIEEGTEFLIRRCGRQDAQAEERDAARELARELDGLPLALEQAAAYIYETKVPFQRYLESYRRRGLQLLEARWPASGRYPKSVVSNWAATFEAVQAESPAAAAILRFSAFLSPDDIPFELVRQAATDLKTPATVALDGGEEDLLVVYDLLRPLSQFSLININMHDDSYSIHRLVQQVIKDAMDEPTRREWTERAIRATSSAFPPVEYSTWPQCERLLPHALALTSEIKRVGIRIVEAGRLLNQTAAYLYERGQYAEAEPFLRQALAILRAARNETFP